MAQASFEAKLKKKLEEKLEESNEESKKKVRDLKERVRLMEQRLMEQQLTAKDNKMEERLKLLELREVVQDEQLAEVKRRFDQKFD